MTNTAGKRSFSGVYDQPDPVDYFTSLRPLRYMTPHHAQPVLRAAARAIARIRSRAPVEMLDLCSGYGVNGALINHDLLMEDLYRHFVRSRGTGQDAALFRKRRLPVPLARVTGVDVAENALAYARGAGLLDDTVRIDLETASPSADQARRLARADMITVTGGFSYVGARTLGRLLALFPRDRLPWMLSFPLRHTDFSACERVFERFGLQVESWDRWAYPHRLFADPAERAGVLAAHDPDADPVAAPPSRSHLEAVLYVARPEEDANRCPLPDLVRARPAGMPGRDGAQAGDEVRQ